MLAGPDYIINVGSPILCYIAVARECWVSGRSQILPSMQWTVIIVLLKDLSEEIDSTDDEGVEQCSSPRERVSEILTPRLRRRTRKSNHPYVYCGDSSDDNDNFSEEYVSNNYCLLVCFCQFLFASFFISLDKCSRWKKVKRRGLKVTNILQSTCACVISWVGERMSNV